MSNEPTADALRTFEAYMQAAAHDGYVEHRLLKPALRQILADQTEDIAARLVELEEALARHFGGAGTEQDRATIKAATTRYVARRVQAGEAIVAVRVGEQMPYTEPMDDEPICGRVLVGQGDDTYDPLCVLPPGHARPCEPEKP